MSTPRPNDPLAPVTHVELQGEMTSLKAELIEHIDKKFEQFDKKFDRFNDRLWIVAGVILAGVAVLLAFFPPA